MTLASTAARTIVRAFERLGLRGAPTLFGLVSRLPGAASSLSRVELPGGGRIRFATFDPYWARYLWGGEPYEPDVELILRRLGAIPGKLLVDCGANIGYWTVRASEPEFGVERAVAVEANPRLIPLLTDNVRSNRIPCEIVHAAIAEEEGRTVLLGHTEHHAVASVGSSGIPVPTVSLAGLIARHRRGGQPVVVKLDVEGSEIAAMRGAPAAGDVDVVYVVEDWPRSGMTVVAYLLEAGFAVVGVDPQARAERISSVEEAIAFNRRTTRVYQPSNFIACRADGLERVLGLFGSS